MPNLYGVANAPVSIGYYATIGGVNIALPTNVETNFIDTGLIYAPSAGWFFPIAWLGIVISIGATATGGLVLGIRANNGADYEQIGFNAAFLTASSTFMSYHTMIGAPSQTLWQNGAHLQISANSQTAPSTILTGGTQVTVALMRAPDQ